MTKSEENKAVKDILTKAGIDVLKVGHGRGTASWWLDIELARPLEFACETHGSQQSWDHQDCPNCRAFQDKMHEINAQTIKLAQAATGRRGDYDGRMSISFGNLF